MTSKKRFSVPVHVEMNGEEYKGRIACALSGGANGWQLHFELLDRDARKKSATPWPILIDFESKQAAHEFVGKAVTALGRR
jgi:hypothetical protein